MVEAGGGSGGCCTGILAQVSGLKGKIGPAALGSSYLPHGRGLREHVGESKSNMDLSVWSVSRNSFKN